MSEAYRVAADLLSRVSEVVEESHLMQEFEDVVWVSFERADWEWLKELCRTVKE